MRRNEKIRICRVLNKTEVKKDLYSLLATEVVKLLLLLEIWFS